MIEVKVIGAVEYGGVVYRGHSIIGLGQRKKILNVKVAITRSIEILLFEILLFLSKIKMKYICYAMLLSIITMSKYVFVSFLVLMLKLRAKCKQKKKRLQIQSQVQIMILLHYLLLIQGWYDLTSESASPDNEAQLSLILCLPAEY